MAAQVKVEGAVLGPQATAPCVGQRLSAGAGKVTFGVGKPGRLFVGSSVKDGFKMLHRKR